MMGYACMHYITTEKDNIRDAQAETEMLVFMMFHPPYRQSGVKEERGDLFGHIPAVFSS